MSHDGGTARVYVSRGGGQDGAVGKGQGGIELVLIGPEIIRCGISARVIKHFSPLAV